MKKYLFFITALLSVSSFIPAAKAQNAVPEPDVKKFFPSLTWKDYIEKKGVVLYMNYYDLAIPAELECLDGGEEESDSVFEKQVLDYLLVPKNCEQAVKWVQAYGQKYPALKNYLTEDQILLAIKEGLSDIFPPEFLANFPILARE